MSSGADYLRSALGPLDGERLPGGCNECSSPEQSFEPRSDGVWIINTFHDDWCPRLARIEGRVVVAGRNQACGCGSGRKAKHCCGRRRRD